MDFKIIWSDAAVADLEDVCSYIAQDDPEAACGVAQGILDHVDILATFPFIGPTYPRGSRGTLRLIVFRSYRILYGVNEGRESVEILNIWHGARDEPPFQQNTSAPS
jgi:toxin ParE1/3/4